MKPQRSSYLKQETEDAVRFRIDEVLNGPDDFDILAEYRALAEAYRTLNRKLYRTLFISDLYQSERLQPPEKAGPPVNEAATEDMQQLVDRLKTVDADLASQAERQLIRYRKLQNRLNKLIAISDRFQGLLHQSNKNKDAFISNLSHELRNPLGTVLGIVDLLQDSTLNADQQKLVDVLAQTGNNLMRIVDEVLDLSRVESGHMEVERIRFPLHDHLVALIEQFRHHRFRRDVELNLIIDDDVPAVISSDSYRIGQILSNLLSNALKFTEQGSITLHVRKLGSDALRFDVIDTGTGIEQDRIDRLFERFVQEDGTIARLYGGSGLGLNIVRELVRLFRGTVSVESEKGKGSTFTVVLPVSFEGTEHKKPEATGRKRILIVEDTPEQRWLIERFLSGEPYVLTIVESGAEAVTASEKEPFDLILLDLQIPGMDGFATFTELQAQIPGPLPPVIALTGRTSDEDRRRTASAGFAAHITKPFTKEALIDVIQRYCRA